jgi:hypothetical protein
VPQDNSKPCDGTMFPSILSAQADRVVSGKVFSFEIVRSGGTFVSHRNVAVNRREWDDCLDCPEFEHCYKFRTGRLALESAIAG